MSALSSAGCDRCSQTGYRGRIGVHEYLEVTPEIRRLIHQRASAADIAQCAAGQSMRTLRQDGIEKALQGLTTLDQVRALCG